MHNVRLFRILLILGLGVICGVLLLLTKEWAYSPSADLGNVPQTVHKPKSAKKIKTHSDPDHPLAFGVGKFCTVQFKRNALGGGADLPVSPLTNVINGAEVSCGGMILSVTQDGLLLEMDGSRHLWIPMDSILLVDVQE